MIVGCELREWRRRNRYTQEMLRMALNIGSRQTIVSWEQSEQPLSVLVELALLALEHLPEKCSLVAGRRLTASEYRRARKQNSMHV
jgi:DNA-binding XRE family transcriptional regulator